MRTFTSAHESSDAGFILQVEVAPGGDEHFDNLWFTLGCQNECSVAILIL